MTAEGVVEALGSGIDAFEAACQEATPTMLRRSLRILRACPEDQEAWVKERAMWAAAFLERILDGRLDLSRR